MREVNMKTQLALSKTIKYEFMVMLNCTQCLRAPI